MHILIFLGIIFGFIGWEMLWGWIDIKLDWDMGPLLGVVVLLVLGLLSFLGFGLWELTGTFH